MSGVPPHGSVVGGRVVSGVPKVTVLRTRLMEPLLGWISRSTVPVPVEPVEKPFGEGSTAYVPGPLIKHSTSKADVASHGEA